MTAATAATELLGRVQTSLTAGYNASAAYWPGAPAPVMPLPASTVGLLLAALAAAKALNPLAAPVLSIPQPQLAGAGHDRQQTQLGPTVLPAAVPIAMRVGDDTASVEPATDERQQ